MIPAASQEPVSSRSSGGGSAHPAQHLGQRSTACEVDRELHASRIAEMHVGIIDARHHEGPMQIEQFGFRLLPPQNRRVISDGDDLVVSHRNGGDPLRVAVVQAQRR